jgi:hypothetical protein
MRLLIAGSFIIGLVPMVVLLGLYAARTPWRVRNNPAGKAMLALFIASVGGNVLSVATVVFPEWGQSMGGQWVRIIGRTVIGLVFWGLLWVFRKAQQAGAAHDAALAGLDTARSYIQDQPGHERPGPAVADTSQEL